jgi:hypothetical protein
MKTHGHRAGVRLTQIKLLLIVNHQQGNKTHKKKRFSLTLCAEQNKTAHKRNRNQFIPAAAARKSEKFP